MSVLLQYKRTALFLACKNGHTSTVELLVDRGADVHQKDIVRWRRGGRVGELEENVLVTMYVYVV